MDINRTGSRNAQFEDPAQKAERTGARFTNSASQPADPAAAAPPAGVPPGITQVDLRDPPKAGEIVMRCFGELVDNMGRQLGAPLSDEQRRNLLEFLGNDPVMRGKLLSYLDQTVK